jgi:hypothetical protein
VFFCFSVQKKSCQTGITNLDWPQWCLVEVEWPLKKFPRADSRVESGLAEEIEDKLGLREKEVLKVM